MSDKNIFQQADEQKDNENVETQQAADNVIVDSMDDVSEQTELSEVDELKQTLATTRADLEKEKKEYLFLMAEFDNYRKRIVKEKADLIKNASEKVLKGLLPIIDDFERGLDATKDIEGSDAVREGMELIYNKFVKYLKDNGVTEMDTKDAVFDPEIHEAIAMVPATDESLKGKILDTVQKGYMLNDKVLRHAKVAVAQ